MIGHIICGRPTPEIRHQGKKTVECMTDIEIRHKLCKDVCGGCIECGVLDVCRYGQEAIRRELI